ncbi:MAG TPA: zinc-binding dehydrogenase, partial [Candidatus Dormibacteraeota bacterium]
CALLSGGGYAELVAVPAGQLLPVPSGLDLLTAAAVPEAFLTAHDNLVTRGRLGAGEIVLIQGGAGGVGTAAIQVARRHGATVLTTAGTAERLERCRELGATGLINHRTEDVGARVRDLTDGRGVDLILDVMGASHLGPNLDVLATDGRLVVIGLQGGARGEIDLGAMLHRRHSLIATTLRSRPPQQKAEIVARAVAELWPGFADGTLRVVVERVYPLAEAAAAHRAMESGGHVGKLLLDVQGGVGG